MDPLITEEMVQNLLSKSELTVYEYIQTKAGEPGGSIKESMKDIGNHLGLSEATVHRAVRKLRKQGVIGIVPSMEKAESNEIIYYGLPDPTKQVGDIFKMISELNSSANRFEAILQNKDHQIEQLKREKEMLYERIEQLELELNQANTGFDVSKILSSQPLDDGTTAYIVKN